MLRVLDSTSSVKLIKLINISRKSALQMARSVAVFIKLSLRVRYKEEVNFFRSIDIEMVNRFLFTVGVML